MIDDDGRFDIIPVTDGAHSDLGWYEAVCTKCGARSGNNAEPHTDDWAYGHTCPSVNMVNHPPHYSAVEGIPFECIVLSRRFTFDVGNAIKYMWRTDRKNGIEDVQKARWYIEDAVATDDLIHADLRPRSVDQTNSLLEVVAKAQKSSARKWFFYSLFRGSLEEAREALDDLLDTWPS